MVSKTRHIFVGSLSTDKLNDTKYVQRYLHVITLTNLQARFKQVRDPLNFLSSLNHLTIT
jgi:hypothetical protein